MDYLVQPDWRARHKQQQTRTGRPRWPHTPASYALTQALAKAAFYRSAGVQVPVLARLAAR